MSDFSVEAEGRILKLVYPTVASMEIVEEFMDAIDAVSCDMPPFVILADLRPLDTSTVTGPIRRRFYERNEAFDVGPHGHKLLAEAIVLDSALARALVSTYYWFKGDRKSYVSKVFRDEASARAFCHAELEKR